MSLIKIYRCFILLMTFCCLSSFVQFALATDPKPQIKRIYFPVDLPGQFPAGDWKPILYSELLDALQSFDQWQPDPAYITNIEIKLSRSSQEQLSGDITLNVSNISLIDQPLNCNTSNIIINELKSANEQLTYGNNPAGELIMIIPPGKSTVSGKITLPYKNTQNLDEINLTLLPCINSKIFLETEVTEVVHSNLGIVKLLPDNPPGKLLWSVSAGSRQELQLRVSTQNSETTPQLTSLVLLDEQETWNVSGSQTNLIVDIKPDIIGISIDQLTFIVPEKLVLQSVGLLSGGPLNYRLEPSGSESKLLIDLPETVPGAYLPIRLRFVLQTVLDRKWTLPQLRSVDSNLIKRNIVLQVKSPLSLKKLQHTGYEQISYTTENNVQDQFQFEWLLSAASLDVELTFPSLFPTSTTVYHFISELEVQKIQGFTLLNYKNIAEPHIEFKVPSNYTLYDLKARSLTEKSNQAVGWRLKSKNQNFDIYELQLLNPPDAESKLLIDWLVSTSSSNTSKTNSQQLILPGILNTNSGADYFVYQAPALNSKIQNDLNLPLEETTLPLELWPPEFTKIVLQSKSDKVYSLPKPVESIIPLNIVDKNVVQQFLEQRLSITDQVKHNYQIPVDTFENHGNFQIEVLGFVHNLDWQLQLKNGQVIRIHPEKEVHANGAIYTFSFIKEIASDATKLLLEIKHPLFEQFSTIQVVPINPRQALPLRFTLESDLTLNYEIDGPFKLLSLDTKDTNLVGKTLELVDASATWLITFKMNEIPQIIHAPLTELTVNSILYHESIPKLEHSLCYKNFSATQLVELLTKLPQKYKLCSITLNQETVDNSEFLVQNIFQYHKDETFQQCQLVFEEEIPSASFGDWQFDLNHFLIKVHSWKISLSLPKSITVERVTGLRSHPEKNEITSVIFPEHKHNHTGLNPASKTNLNAQNSPSLKAFHELASPTHLQTYQIYELMGYGLTIPETINVKQRSYNYSLKGLLCSIICLVSTGIFLRMKNKSWGYILLFSYLFLSCTIWWIDASSFGIIFFTAGICGMLFPDLEGFFHNNNSDHSPLDSSADHSTKMKSHSSITPVNIFFLLLLPFAVQPLAAQEPASPKKSSQPTTADLLRSADWDVIIPFSGDTPKTTAPGEIVYVSTDLHQVLKNHSKQLSENDHFLFKSAQYNCDLELDGNFRVAADLLCAAPASELELKIPLNPKEFTIAGIHGCLIENQIASVSSQTDSYLILKIPAAIQKSKMGGSKTDSSAKQTLADNSTQTKNKWVNYNIHLDFYPKPVDKSAGAYNYHLSIPTINNSFVVTNFKSRIDSGTLKTAYGEYELSGKFPQSISLGNISFLDINLQQKSTSRNFLDLEFHLITLWDAVPMIPKAQVLLEISGIEKNLTEFSLPIPAYIRIKNIYGNDLLSYQLIPGKNPSIYIKLKEETKNTSYFLLDCEYLNPELLNSSGTVLHLPPFNLPELKPGVDQRVSSTTRQIGINPANGYQLKEILPEQSGFSPIARDMLYRASPLDFPLTPQKETDLTRSLWESFISKPPAQLYRITKDETFSVELIKSPQTISASMSQQLVIKTDKLDFSATIKLPPRATPYYQIVLKFDEQTQIESASCKQRSISRPLKWSQSENNLTLFLEDLPGDPLTIQLLGTRLLPTNKAQIHSDIFFFLPAGDSPLMRLDSNELSITNQASDKWEISAQPDSSAPPSMKNLPTVNVINLNLPANPKEIVIKPFLSSSPANTTQDQILKQNFAYSPVLNQSSCQWTHLQQSLHNDRISGVSVCRLDSGLPVLDFNVNEKYKVTSITINGKPLPTFSQQGSRIKLKAVNQSELILNILISWELIVIPRKYFEWPEVIADSNQLNSIDARWIWFKQSLADLKPNRKLELQDQVQREQWISDLNNLSSSTPSDKSTGTADLTVLTSLINDQKLIFLTSSEMKSCLWVYNFKDTYHKSSYWKSYTLLIPFIMVLAYFVVNRLGTKPTYLHFVPMSLSAFLIHTCYIAYPTQAVISLLLIAHVLMYRLLVTNQPHQNRKKIVLKLKS